MTINVTDKDKFVQDMLDGAMKDPTALNHFYVEPGLMINVSEITACHAAHLEG